MAQDPTAPPLLYLRMRIPLLFAALLMAGACLAQETTAPKPFRSLIYGGYGGMFPSSGMKENSMIKNGISFRFGYFQGIGKAKPMGKGLVQFGAELRIEYSKFPHEIVLPPSLQALRYDNGTSTPVPLNPDRYAKDKKPDAFQYLAGPSAVYSKDKFFVQPSVLLGYGSVSQEEFQFTETLRYQGTPQQTARVEEYIGTHETNNGFVAVPGVKAGYRISKRLSAFADLTYALGSKQEFTDAIIAPLGPPNDQGVYSFSQLRGAQLNTYNREGKFRAFFASVNLALTF